MMQDEVLRRLNIADILTWLAKECVISRLLPEGMGQSQGPHGRARASNCGSLAGSRRARHRGKKNGEFSN
jgi:hypothetical protein